MYYQTKQYIPDWNSVYSVLYIMVLNTTRYEKCVCQYLRCYISRVLSLYRSTFPVTYRDKYHPPN